MKFLFLSLIAALSLTTNGGTVVSATVMREFPSGELRLGYPVSSAVITWEVDCGRRLARQLEQTFFSDRNASGEVILAERTDSPWTPFSQHDEASSKAFETACL